jgi:hypothetical protein
MKVGLILECGLKGADKAVCEHLLRMLLPGVVVDSVTLDNKPKMIAGCGKAAADLLSSGCERVVIVWDLYPAWRKDGERPCRKQDRTSILKSLTDAGVNTPNVFLVCIKEELEAWLLADRSALEAVLGRPSRAADVPNIRKPEQQKNPKKRLDKIFRDNAKGPYTDHVHAIWIVRQLDSVNILAKRSESFRRFALKAANLVL